MVSAPSTRGSGLGARGRRRGRQARSEDAGGHQCASRAELNGRACGPSLGLVGVRGRLPSSPACPACPCVAGVRRSATEPRVAGARDVADARARVEALVAAGDDALVTRRAPRVISTRSGLSSPVDHGSGLGAAVLRRPTPSPCRPSARPRRAGTVSASARSPVTNCIVTYWPGRNRRAGVVHERLDHRRPRPLVDEREHRRSRVRSTEAGRRRSSSPAPASRPGSRPDPSRRRWPAGAPGRSGRS